MAIIALVFSVSGALLSAQSETSAGHLWQAQEVLSFCRPVAMASVENRTIELPDTLRAGICWGAFGVLQEVIGWTEPDGTMVLRACVPLERTRSELVAVFVSYLDQHPTRRSDRFVEVALDALRAAYPCPPLRR